MVGKTQYCCIYRTSTTLDICGRCLESKQSNEADKDKKEIFYCSKHKKYANIIYEILFYALGYNSLKLLSAVDIYNIYVFIYDNVNFNNTTELSDNDIKNILLVKVLNKFPRNKCFDIYSIYFNINKNIMPSKSAMIDRLYKLCSNTYQTAKDISKMKHIIKLQRLFRKNINKSLSVNIHSGGSPVNTEDPFSSDDIDDIPINRVFAYYDECNNLYAFDAIELDYFVQKCNDDKIIPYNPYTRKSISDHLLRKLEMFIKYNKLKKRNINDLKWETHLQAFTDLSIEIEVCGFYNSPEWFVKMSEDKLKKSLKMFRDFSADIYESHEYFAIYNRDTFIYDFCKEGIRMFKTCKDDKYVLCCNFMKALAFYSKDFYNNLPSWLVNTRTTSRISNLFQNLTIGSLHDAYTEMSEIEINNMDMIRGSLMRHDRVYNNMNEGNHSRGDINGDNFLLYYYVEYMQ